MKTIDVCLSPELMHLYTVEDKTVVIVDIFRATSCMVTAFAHGVQSITPFSNLDACLAMKKHGYITSGERDGKKPQGFDKGNSPFEYMEAVLQGGKIAFTTTNGTLAIEKAKGAKEVLIGSFLNLSTLVKYLLFNENNILIVCSGWKGKINLEDTLFAGSLMEILKDHIEPDCDAPIIAQHLYNLARANIAQFLSTSSHVKRLSRLNVHRDISFCLTIDQYRVLPSLQNGIIILDETNGNTAF